MVRDARLPDRDPERKRHQAQRYSTDWVKGMTMDMGEEVNMLPNITAIQNSFELLCSSRVRISMDIESLNNSTGTSERRSWR